MSSHFYNIDCDGFLIGTVDGNKKDAKEFVEAQVNKYFDVPNECYYRIIKSKESGFHYEIQESSKTGSVLDKVLKAIENDEDSDVFIYGKNGIQYQVYQRKDGSLRTFIRGHDDLISPEVGGIEDLNGSMAKFTPYFSKITGGVVASGMFFFITLTGSLIASSFLGAQYMAQKGHVNALQTTPINLFLKSSSVFDLYVENYNNLPVNGGLNAIKRFNRSEGKTIGKLEYNGRWNVVAKKTTTDKVQENASGYSPVVDQHVGRIKQ